MSPYDWANSMAVLARVFLWCGEYGFSTVGISVILQNGYGIQGPDIIELVQQSEIAAGCHCRKWT